MGWWYQLMRGDHLFTMYQCIQSRHCTSYTYTMFYVNCISKQLGPEEGEWEEAQRSNCLLCGVLTQSRPTLWPHELVPFNTPGESSQPRAGTWLSCIGRRILYHCATWETHIHLHILKMIAVTLVLPCKTPPLNNSFLRVWKILIF